MCNLGHFLSLLCVLLHISSLLSDRFSQVGYFSFTSTVQSTSASRFTTTVFAQVLAGDDTPFTRVDLPWKFNLLGENVDHMFVSPNGGLYRSCSQPCPPSNWFGTLTCGLSNSHYNVIGGLFTDLNPHNSSNGNITSYISGDRITIEYRDIAYFGTSLNNTFRIVLFEDSHIEILYDRIIKNSKLPKYGGWSSGLRASVKHEYAYVSAAQRAFGVTEWGNAGNVSGIYPRKADVASGKQFNICPVSRSWCVSPATISRNDSLSANPTDYITFTSTLLSCTSSVRYGALFTSVDSTLTYNIPCTMVHNVSLQCSIADLLSHNIVAGAYNATPAWRTHDSNTFAPLPIDSLLVNVVNTSLFNTTSHSYQVGCANNVHNAACGGDSCALCIGDFSCLDLPCGTNSTANSTSSTSTVPVGLSSAVYDRVTCADTCPLFTTNSSNTYDLDYTQQCCTLSQMDCSGRCGGVALMAHTVDGTLLCCSSGFVDCEGVCRDYVADSCYDPSDVTVSLISSQQSAFYPVYDITSGSDGLVRVLQLNVTNKSLFAVLVALSEPVGTIATNPVLTLSVLVVQPHTSAVMSVTSSIATLMQVNSSTWANKYFEVQYRRTSDATPLTTRRVSVYPQVTGCDTLTSARKSCMRLPGCIFCFVNPLMRLLRQDEAPDTSSNVGYSETSAARKLFIELVPWSLADPGDYLSGVCADGYVNSDCKAIAPYAFVSAAGHSCRWSVLSMLTTALVLISTVLY